MIRLTKKAVSQKYMHSSSYVVLLNRTYCRGLEPAISRLWGKGISITLARMGRSAFNLGVVLCDYTGATVPCNFVALFVIIYSIVDLYHDNRSIHKF